MSKAYKTLTENIPESFQDIDLSKTYTYAEYLKFKFDERVELIKGKIFDMSPAPRTAHQRVSRQLSFQMISHLKDNPCEVFIAPFDVRFPTNDSQEIYTVVQPDICVVCDPSKIDDLGCLGAPDLIVEILSPHTSKKDYTVKHQLYEEQGVSEYWLVSSEGVVEKYILVNNTYQFEGRYFKQDTMSSTTIEELEIDLSEVF